MYYLILLFTKIAEARVTGTQSGQITIPNPLGAGSFAELLQNIVEFLTLYIAPPLVTLMILWGAFQIMSAGGNPEKITQGKKTILYAVVGFAIVLVGWGFVSIIEEILGV